MSASPGQGTLLIDFAEATGSSPADLALFGTTAAGSFPVGDVASVCAAPVEWPTAPHAGAAPGHVGLVTGADHPAIGPSSRKGSAKERRESRFPPLRAVGAVAERLGITDRGGLCRSSTFLTGFTKFVVPPSYEPLDESVRLSAARRRAIMKPTDRSALSSPPLDTPASPGIWTGRATSKVRPRLRRVHNMALARPFLPREVGYAPH